MSQRIPLLLFCSWFSYENNRTVCGHAPTPELVRVAAVRQSKEEVECGPALQSPWHPLSCNPQGLSTTIVWTHLPYCCLPFLWAVPYSSAGPSGDTQPTECNAEPSPKPQPTDRPARPRYNPPRVLAQPTDPPKYVQMCRTLWGTAIPVLLLSDSADGIRSAPSGPP